MKTLNANDLLQSRLKESYIHVIHAVVSSMLISCKFSANDVDDDMKQLRRPSFTLSDNNEFMDPFYPRTMPSISGTHNFAEHLKTWS